MSEIRDKLLKLRQKYNWVGDFDHDIDEVLALLPDREPRKDDCAYRGGCPLVDAGKCDDCPTYCREPPEGEALPDLGICLACHSTLDPEQIERMGGSWGHVVPVMGHDGPEPSQCGPVEAYYKRPAPSSEKALKEAIVSLESLLDAHKRQGAGFGLPYEEDKARQEYAERVIEDAKALLASSPAPEAPKC